MTLAVTEVPALLINFIAGMALPFFVGLVYWTTKARKLATDLMDARASEAEALARARAIHDILPPLLWLWGLAVGPREKSYVASSILVVQAVLGLTDEEMAEEVADCPEPPRRVPKSQKPPVYLAGPEDFIHATPTDVGTSVHVVSTITPQEAQDIATSVLAKPQPEPVFEPSSFTSYHEAHLVETKTLVCPQDHRHQASEGQAEGWPCPECGGPMALLFHVRPSDG